MKGSPLLRRGRQSPCIGERGQKDGEFFEAVLLEKIPGYAERPHVRPGLSGLTQVYADRDPPPAQVQDRRIVTLVAVDASIDEGEVRLVRVQLVAGFPPTSSRPDTVLRQRML